MTTENRYGIVFSDESFRTLVNESADGILAVNHSGVVLFVNPAAELLLGRSADDLVGKEFGYPITSNKSTDLTIIRANGEIVHVELRAADSHWNNEPSFIISLRDITDKMNSQANLKRLLDDTRKLTAENRELFDAAKAVLIERNFKVAARRLFDSCCKMTGAISGYVALLNEAGDENEVLFLESGGLPCSVNPQLPMPIRGLRGEAYAFRKTVYENHFMESEWVEFMPPGHVPLKNVLFAPLNIEEKTIGLIGLANKPSDFTEHDVQIASTLGDLAAISLQNSRTRESLLKSEAALEEAQEVARVGSWLYDIKNNKATWSKEMFRLFGRERPLGEPCWIEHKEIIHPDDWDRIDAAVQTAIHEGTGYDCEFRVLRPDGGCAWLNTIGNARRNSHGEIVELYGTVQDITDRKTIEEEKEFLHQQFLQSQKMEAVGQLAGGIAHDFNNLLTPIIGYCELALMRMQPGDALYTDFKEIHKAGDRAKDLTRQLLAFARKQPLDMKVVKLSDIVVNFEKMLRRLVREDIEIRYKHDPEQGCIKADQSQIEQIIMNLAVNAKDAMPDGGVLFLETANAHLGDEYVAETPDGIKGAYSVLSISDTGQGMDKALLGDIFNPFFTTKEVGKGTGLGLSTVHGIVKQHGGNIHVYSEPGRGTTFKIYLPRTGDESVKVESCSETICGGSETILIIEDDKRVLTIAKRIIAGLGYHVLCSNSPNDAIDLASDYDDTIHLLLTDVIMPGMNGMEVYETLASSRPIMKVLFMSGYTGDVINYHSLMDSKRHFLNKPFSANGLALKIREALDQA